MNFRWTFVERVDTHENHTHENRPAKIRETALPIVEWPKVLIFERRSEEPLPDLRRILPVCGSEGLAETSQESNSELESESG
jgi:hypothetical protein